ncbi:XdhC family protein [Phormidium tenue]|uniref:Xanthine dehydrogenase n=1 Tax=Phormidium tenue NIES-30 TaxID=549789 RepID=A0A1U7IXM6_9CYAN|nr:XdhC/CoxI family protein [Phormidium tenue]MBD2233936.1 XdhC family protein [Phormidium tenue FACHB-1052]OKH43043.1 xanthine dehydrogenase [Phormidium tenue NIES-30]
MPNCFQQLAQALAYGPAVLATVTSVKGSVPREVGAKLVVDATGQAFNTIGGGAGEAKVIRQAKEVLQTGEKQFVDIDLSGAPQRQTQGICGGHMRVWLERWQGEAAKSLVQRILHRLHQGQSATLVTPLDGVHNPYLEDKRVSIDAAIAFVETLEPPPTLLIVGAGHVGIQLAKVAALIGFQIVVQDDRPDWANAKHYPQANQVLIGEIGAAIATLAAHQNLYAALVTRGYTYDLDALQQLLQRSIPCRYIGMIGSEKRVRQVYGAIAQTGIAKEKLAHIYGPIGLDIGALTPEEIAVSIGAELILVQRGGTGRSLSERLRESLLNN